MDAINFRLSLVPQFGVDVLNWPDTKIGSRMIEQKLGPELCYETVLYGFSGRRVQQKENPTNAAVADCPCRYYFSLCSI